MSSLRKLFKGNPTPILSAAAVGTDIVRLVIICGGGVEESVGGCDGTIILTAAAVGGNCFPMLSTFGKSLLGQRFRTEL